MWKNVFFLFALVFMKCQASETLNTLKLENYSAKVVIVYYTETNHTKTLAESIASGASSVGSTDVQLLFIDDVDMKQHIFPADAVIIGAPVHFGNVASSFLLWIEEAWKPYWTTHDLDGKLGGVFTTGGGIAQGVEHVLSSLQRTLQSFRFRVVLPDPTSSPYTSYGCFAATGTPPFNLSGAALAQPFLDVAVAYGKQIALLAAKDNFLASQAYSFR